jgi:Fic family protein
VHPHTRRDTRTSRPVSPDLQARIDQKAAQKEERLAATLAYVRDHGSITSFDIRQLFGVSLQTANSYTRDLVADGSLTKTVTVSYTLPR